MRERIKALYVCHVDADASGINGKLNILEFNYINVVLVVVSLYIYDVSTMSANTRGFY